MRLPDVVIFSHGVLPYLPADRKSRIDMKSNMKKGVKLGKILA